MGIKKFKPTTPGQRFKTGSDFVEITANKPYKKLTKGLSKKSGRGAGGKISVRRRGGGHKRKYRIIDFKRQKHDVEAKVLSIEYDPNRSARIALVAYEDGDKRYIIAPEKIKVGDTLINGSNVKSIVGNSLILKNIPLGTWVHNIEIYPGKGGQIARSAGTFAQLTAKENKYCNLRLPSGEVRKILSMCTATVGQVGNLEHNKISLGKAGRRRWLGRRSKVRGVAMNPVDHPHGGGEGKTSGGRHPVSPWGTPTKGYKTRNKKKLSNKFIVSKRKKK